MATRESSVELVEGFKDEARVITWAGLLNGDDGAPVEIVGYADRSIQFSGTFGAGGTIQVEGSNNGTAWHILTNPQGDDIQETSGALQAIMELPRFIRPRVSGGDGTTNLQAILLAKLAS